MCVFTHLHLNIHKHAYTYMHTKLQFSYCHPKQHEDHSSGAVSEGASWSGSIRGYNVHLKLRGPAFERKRF